MNKRSLIILCGGKSVEHDVSILSARNIFSALKYKKFDVKMVFIAHSGEWFCVNPHDSRSFEAQREHRIAFIPGQLPSPFFFIDDFKNTISVDCLFPALHGTQGEDGVVQGLLELLGLPYVGSRVLPSAICMEKNVTKCLLRFSGLPTLDWVSLDEKRSQEYSYAGIKEQLGPLLFVKPTALGSSVSISKVRNHQEYEIAIQEGFKFHQNLIVERGVVGREIECSVLGNDDPVASLPGELITSHDFYSYYAKYCDPDSLKVITPAKLPDTIVRYIQEMAINAFKVLQCQGMARIDFFVTHDQEIFINEVNTIPGFTDFSMYPKNWEASGLSYPDLLEDLIELAIKKHEQKSRFLCSNSKLRILGEMRQNEH